MAELPSCHPSGPSAGFPSPSTWEILFDERQISSAVGRLAAALERAHAGRELTVVVVLDGALIFAADLVRRLTIPTRLQTIRASSYRGRVSGPVHVTLEGLELSGRHVLLVDDILDTGRTFSRLLETLRGLNPASLETCVLVDKPGGRQLDIQADRVGLIAPDRFIVGYGLDWEGRFRHLPFIAALPVVDSERPRR